MRILALALALAAAPALAEEWTGPDKTLHFFMIGAAPAAIVTLYTGSPWKGFATGVALGAVKEALDASTTNGKASGKDFAVTALGAALGAYTGKWVLGYQQGTYTVAYATGF